jgi:hypothetical protein
MRSSRLHLAVAVTLLTAATIHGQTAATGRIDGTIVDTTSSVLPGVTVAIIANGESQFTVTDGMGRYAFEKIGSATYALTATLPGFRNQQLEGVVVTADTTTTVDLTLKVGCLEEVHTVGDTSLNQLLTSDVVVYLRVTEHGLDRFIESRDSCYTANEAPATILDVVHTSRAQWRRGVSIPLHAMKTKLHLGEEYLAFMNFDETLGRFVLDDVRLAPVRNSQVEWYDDRYRQYDSTEPTRSLKELRYKTAWVPLGSITLRGNEWKEDQPFEFVDEPSADRFLPLRNDRIRVAKESHARILDFGWRGEELRDVSPTTRGHERNVSDLTGARVSPETIYTVADIQFEQLDEERIVWVRLVSD